MGLVRHLLVSKCTCSITGALGLFVISVACSERPETEVETEETSEPSPDASLATKDIGAAFPSKLVKLQAEHGKSQYHVEWAYTNPYELPMVIQEVDSDCGCLVVQVDSTKMVAEGETDKIVAAFLPGVRRGLLRISLKVRFVGYDKPVSLFFEAKIPAPVETSVHELTWAKPHHQQTQVVEVTTGTSTDFKIIDVTGVPDGLFIIKTETVKEGRHYRLHLTPTAKLQSGVQYLQIHTDAEDPNDQMVEVYLRME